MRRTYDTGVELRSDLVIAPKARGSDEPAVEERSARDQVRPTKRAQGRASIVVGSLLLLSLWGGAILLFWILVDLGWKPGVAFVTAGAVQFFVVAALELCLPYREEWLWKRDRQSINDAVHWFVNMNAGPLLTAGLSVWAIGTAAQLREAAGVSPWPQHWPWLAQFAVLVLLADLADWAKHWLMHNVSFFWTIHALHHSAAALHVGKSLRFHFLEPAARFFIASVPFLLIGVPESLLLWYLAVMSFLGKVNHSNLKLELPNWLHYVIGTPQVHRIHHSVDEDLGRSNLSAVTMLPDLLFGTFRHPAKHPLGACGVASEKLPSAVLGQLAHPFVKPFAASVKSP